MKIDIKIFATVGENAVPMAVPCICWKYMPAK